MASEIEALERVATLAPTVVQEAVAEFTGQSKRKWALFLIAFVLGVAIAGAFYRFEKRTATGAANPTATASDTSAAIPRDTQPLRTSTWSQRRIRIARSEAEMRARVGRAGSRMNLRRHESN